MPCNWKFAAENFQGDGYHNISHRSVDLVGIGPSGRGRRDNERMQARRFNVSFPELGHGAHPVLQLEDVPYIPTYQNTPIVEEYFRHCYEERQRRLGQRARLLGSTGTVFPNMSILSRQPRSIAVWHPRGALKTEAWRWFLVDADAPQEVKDVLRHYALRYSGPADTLWRLTGSEVIDMSGPLALGADITGRFADPVIRGSLKTANGRIESQVTGMVIDHVASQARFSGPQLIFSEITGQTTGGGSVAGNGTVTFSGGKTQLNLSFNANQALLLNRDDVAARVTGPLQLKSGANGGIISGDLKLNKGRFQLGRASAAAAVPQLNVRETGLDEEDVIEPAALHPWKLDVKLAGSDLQVTGLGINSRWTANLQIGGLADSPRFTGRADLVQGNYDFAGRIFRLDRGVIRFRNESPPDPLLDIHAEAAVQGLNATVTVAGTGLKPEITFASLPPMPQDELLSRILFGTSITNLSAPEALQLASAVAALQSGNGSLDPINALRRAVGLDRLRIVPADVATGQKTALAAGKYITRKLYVEVVTDGAGYSATQVEYQMTRWLSVLSTVSTIGRSSASVRVSKDY